MIDLRSYKVEIEDLRIGIKVLELALKEKTDRMEFILNTEILNLMSENGIESIDVDGMTFTYSDELFASIRANFKREAIEWLKDNSGSGKIKEQLLVETDDAKKLMDELKEHQLVDSIDYDAKIHWKTLQSILKALMADGITAPEEYFSVYYKSKVKAS